MDARLQSAHENIITLNIDDFPQIVINAESHSATEREDSPGSSPEAV